MRRFLDDASTVVVGVDCKTGRARHRGRFNHPYIGRADHEEWIWLTAEWWDMYRAELAKRMAA